MSNINVVNNLKNKRGQLLDELEQLTKVRAQRSTYISPDLNKKIFKLEEQIRDLTLKHRDEIKKCYSGARKVPKN